MFPCLTKSPENHWFIFKSTGRDLDLVTTETIPADSPQPRIKRHLRSYLRDYACNKKSPTQALGQFTGAPLNPMRPGLYVIHGAWLVNPVEIYMMRMRKVRNNNLGLLGFFPSSSIVPLCVNLRPNKWSGRGKCYFENIQKVWFTGESSPAEE